MPGSTEYDVLVVGAGIAGTYAAATAANAGLDVCVFERKSQSEAGHIACGDAIKNVDAFPEAIPRSKVESAITNPGLNHGLFEIPETGETVDIRVPGELAVVDRWKYGQLLIEAAREAGVDFEFETVVTDVVQTDGVVTGIQTNANGTAETVEADVVIDGGGALSLLQDRADFQDSTFDTNVTFRQFSSAYREILELDEPVEWNETLILKPTERSAGYLWYFPRTPTQINVGLGFQMTSDPIYLVEELRSDIGARPEFDGARVVDKLGAALPTRRPYDSAVAPGYIAVGDAAAHVNPTTGGGIAGAAYGGAYAAETAIKAIEQGDVSEETLWEYNGRFMDHFGARYAGLDVYNIMITAVDVDELMGLLTALPAQKLTEALYSGTASLDWLLKLRTFLGGIGYWSLLSRLYRTKREADRLIDHYDRYPDNLDGFATWQDQRDDIMEDIYEVTGADPKY